MPAASDPDTGADGHPQTQSPNGDADRHKPHHQGPLAHANGYPARPPSPHRLCRPSPRPAHSAGCTVATLSTTTAAVAADELE